MSLRRRLFGHNEYVNGVHIAHEPSWWQRRKARQQAEDLLFDRFKLALEDPRTRIMVVKD